MLYLCTHIISKLYAVAGRYCGVCGIVVHSADTACCKYGGFCGIITVLSLMQYIGKEAVASLGKSEQVGIFKDSNIRQFLYSLNKRGHYLKACAVLMMRYSVTAMAALKCKVYRAVGFSVKIHSVVEKIFYILGALFNQNTHIVDIIFVAACNKRIFDMQFVVVIGGIHNSGNAALGKCGIAQRKFSF